MVARALRRLHHRGEAGRAGDREGPYGCEHVDVDEQRRDPQSLLNWTARMIRLRKECPEIGWGDWTVLPAGLPNVLVLCYEWRGNSVVVVHNFGNLPQEARFRVKVEDGKHLADLMLNDDQRAGDDGMHRVALPVYGYKWCRVGGTSYAVRATRDCGVGKAW